MRLTLAGSLVLIWSAIQLKSQVLDIWRDKKKLPALLAYAILGIFQFNYFFLFSCVEYSNAATATILQFISPVFILFYNRLVYQKRASKSAIFYVLVAMLGCLLVWRQREISLNYP